VHYNLGIALYRQGRYKEAEAEFRQALRLRPDYPEAHLNLGIALNDLSRYKEAEAECRQALRLRPDYPEAHLNLGNALNDQGRYKEAEAECREALRLRPDFPEARRNLAFTLLGQRRYKEAEAECREALRLQPHYPDGHLNLGSALYDQGRYKEAEAEFRAVLRLKPDFPLAHLNLGLALREQGRFPEALQSLRRGHVLGRKSNGWRSPSADWVRQCERLVELDRKLPAILKGQAQPASPAERLDLANLCQLPSKRLYAAAARLAADAFTADPKLAEDMQARPRYNAACAAALAAAGQGEDAGKLDPRERSALREQALGWLRAALDVQHKSLANAKPPQRQAILQTLRHWYQDTDLAGVRDPKALAALPAAERAAWKKLWADVADLARKAEGKK
jgi:Flp pilus assembly protein TadD